MGGKRAVVLSGLPGSGKSTFAAILQDLYDYEYVSTDVARAELLRLTRGKYASTSEYKRLKSQVYDYVRELAGMALARGKRVVIDGTHLNEQLPMTLDYLRTRQVTPKEVVVVYVTAGGKERVRQRFVAKPGRNGDGRTWVEAWETAYDFFAQQLKMGEVVIPENKVLECPVVWVKN